MHKYAHEVIFCLKTLCICAHVKGYSNCAFFLYKTITVKQ